MNSMPVVSMKMSLMLDLRDCMMIVDRRWAMRRKLAFEKRRVSVVNSVRLVRLKIRLGRPWFLLKAPVQPIFIFLTI